LSLAGLQHTLDQVALGSLGSSLSPSLHIQ